MRGKAQRDGRPLGGSKLRSYLSPFVNQSTQIASVIKFYFHYQSKQEA